MAEISYDLAGAHPYYCIEVPVILDQLSVRYPDAPLQRVELFQRETDTSLASNDSKTLRLNAYWFAADPEFLKQASRLGRGWHCCLGQEPRRVLTHEFGHSLMAARPALRQWAREAWREATAKPWLAPSGYAMISDEEYFPEAFAALELRALTAERARRMQELLTQPCPPSSRRSA